MHDTLRSLFPEQLSDETAYHLVNFFYELALAFESAHLGEVLRYQKAIIESGNDPMNHDALHNNKTVEKELSDTPF